VASLSQGRTAAAQCGLFTHKSVPVIFEPPCKRQGKADLTPADFFLWGPIEGQSVQKYTPHNRTTQRRHTPRDSSRQRSQFGKSIPEFGETHSSVLGCERKPVSASIMSSSCFVSLPVCVYKFSNHYLSNIIFYR